MPVGLPSVAETADPDLEVVQLFCLGGLTFSLYVIHLMPIIMTNAMMLLACTG